MTNFNDHVGSNKYVLLEFYSKWCKFCKILAPTLDQLVDKLKEQRKDILIARIDGTLNDIILAQYGIFRFPILALFKPNSKQIYTMLDTSTATAESLSKSLNEMCPVLDNNPKNVKIENDSEIKKVNLSELEKMKNLTEESEYIKEEFIGIKKRIENIQNKIKNIGDDNNKNDFKAKKNNNIWKIDIVVTPMNIFIAFIGFLIFYILYIIIDKILNRNKEHLKV